MKCRFALRALSLLLPTAHLLAFQQTISIPHHNPHAARTNNAVALSATRENRSYAGRASSTSSSPSSAQEQQLITTEEAARLKRVGQAKRRRERRARLEDRVSYLESLPFNAAAADDDGELPLSDAQRKELEGLLETRDMFEDQYDPTTFSEAHVEFKRMHNDAFVALARFCQRDRRHRNGDSDGDHNDTVDDDDNGKGKEEDPNVFYLDGADGATSSALEKSGFDPSCCYVANRHLETCQILRNRLPEKNVIHCTAAEALTPTIADTGSDDDDATGTDFDDNPSFSDVDFSAYYFDGCGGFVPHIVGMMTAALIRPAASPGQKQQQRKTTAVGFSLMGGNRDVIEKELVICRALAIIARTRGMRTRHVLDDPGRYGIPMEIAKTEKGTFTSWMLLEED